MTGLTSCVSPAIVTVINLKAWQAMRKSNLIPTSPENYPGKWHSATLSNTTKVWASLNLADDTCTKQFIMISVSIHTSNKK